MSAGTLSLPVKAKPAAPAPEPRKSHPLEFMVGKRIVIQRGPVTYVGRLTAITGRWLVLDDAEVVGSNRSACPGQLWVNNEVNHIGHFHLAEGDSHD